MEFKFNDYIMLVKRTNPTYERRIRSNLHELTTYLKDHANRADPKKVISLTDGIKPDRRMKYKDALAYITIAALKQNLLDSTTGKQLSQIYRPNVTGAVIDDLLNQWKANLSGNVKKFGSMLEGLLEVERKNCQAVQLQVAKLHNELATGFQKYFDAYKMEEQKFNKGGETDHCTRAARWVCFASSTIKEDRVPTIKTFLKNAVLKKHAVCTMVGVDQVHRQIVGQVNRGQRTPTGGSHLPSDKGGRALFERAIARIPGEKVNKDLGCYLFGIVIRCHPFIDGNGRVARTLFATCQLRERMIFEPITVQGEDKLLGFAK